MSVSLTRSLAPPRGPSTLSLSVDPVCPGGRPRSHAHPLTYARPARCPTPGRPRQEPRPRSHAYAPRPGRHSRVPLWSTLPRLPRVDCLGGRPRSPRPGSPDSTRPAPDSRRSDGLGLPLTHAGRPGGRPRSHSPTSTRSRLTHVLPCARRALIVAFTLISLSTPLCFSYRVAHTRIILRQQTAAHREVDVGHTPRARRRTRPRDVDAKPRLRYIENSI